MRGETEKGKRRKGEDEDDEEEDPENLSISRDETKVAARNKVKEARDPLGDVPAALGSANILHPCVVESNEA